MTKMQRKLNKQNYIMCKFVIVYLKILQKHSVCVLTWVDRWTKYSATCFAFSIYKPQNHKFFSFPFFDFDFQSKILCGTAVLSKSFLNSVPSHSSDTDQVCRSVHITSRFEKACPYLCYFISGVPFDGEKDLWKDLRDVHAVVPGRKSG